ncbi:hypothetical protein GDO81_002696 [Engystomops pustulosus]|uniref:Uncharacterized protein n=1 Tax=Engystomops pustulosus TaxID=76066 RepID=A0AAV7DPW7_ENGPU|nr:hypothetical protein GDO81_002696 [Engystomops pustulosus]
MVKFYGEQCPIKTWHVQFLKQHVRNESLADAGDISIVIFRTAEASRKFQTSSCWMDINTSLLFLTTHRLHNNTENNRSHG